MSELIATTKRHFELSDTLRMATLTVFTAVLAVAFLALLISDQVQAAGL